MKTNDTQNISGEERTRWLTWMALMNMQVPMLQLHYPTQSKSPLDRMLERLEWENNHCLMYKILHWRDRPET